MATSGTYTEHSNNLAVISNALRKIGRLGDHETLADTDARYTKALAALKPLVKEFATLGMPLWQIHETTIALSNFTTSAGITIGVSGATITNASPIKLLQVVRRDSVTASAPLDYEMMIYTAHDYNAIPNKSQTGTPIGWTYYPEEPVAVHPVKSTLKVWPLPDSYWTTNGSLLVRYQGPVQDVGTSTQDLDFPAEWQRLVIYTLACDLCNDYGVDVSRADRLNAQRQKIYDQVVSFAGEEGSFRIQPTRKR